MLRGVALAGLFVASCASVSARPANDAESRTGAVEDDPSQPAPPVLGSRAFGEVVGALSRDRTSSWDPTRAWLTSYVEQNGRLRMTFEALDSDDVTQFQRRLSASATFERLTVIRVSAKANGEIEASIVSDVDGPHVQLSLSVGDRRIVDAASPRRNPFVRIERTR